MAAGVRILECQSSLRSWSCTGKTLPRREAFFAKPPWHVAWRGYCYLLVILVAVSILPPTAWLGFTIRPSMASHRQGLTLRHASEPWKPLVFKMPRKKPPRDTVPGDDGYTTKMRQRIKDMKVKQQEDSEVRAVSETKAADLVSREIEDARISANYALWVTDRTHDKVVEEQERPDATVWRRRYDAALKHLDEKAAGMTGADQKNTEEAPASRRSRKERPGLLKLHSRFETSDTLLQSRAQEVEEMQRRKASQQAAKLEQPLKEPAPDREETDAEDAKIITEYLEAVQRRSATESRVSRRVVKSPAQRQQEYEDMKQGMVLGTIGCGGIGTSLSYLGFGVNEAFSFGLGSIAALLYISGLSSYTDNAESPVGTAVGGRRFLVPILLVLIIVQWPKLEILSPEIASLGLQPVLPAALLGFFTYNLGKVLSGLLQK